MNGKTYLTTGGAKKFREELDNLKGPVREQLAIRLRAAIQQGDLSENADYTSAKEEQSFVEGRILDLEIALKDVVIIDDLPKNKDIIQIGSKVTVKEKGGDVEIYTMVGPLEANPIIGSISFESPLGKALLDHCKGEIVHFEIPEGIIEFSILKVE
jgi:transcription elongation factor GreA